MGAEISVTPASLTLVAGAHGEVQVENHGNETLHVTAIHSSGDASAEPSAFEVAAQGSHGVTVNASSELHSGKVATLTFESNAGTAHVEVKGITVPHKPPHHGIGFGGYDPNGDTGDGSPSGDGWGAGGDDGCFVAGTLVLGPDGPRPIESLAIGDEILTVGEDGHHLGDPATVRARIEAVHRHDGSHALVSVGGIAATPVHRWAIARGDRAEFAPADALVDGVTVRTCSRAGSELRAAPPVAPLPTAEIVFNLTTSARTYAVAATAEGPYYVVHNAKKRTVGEPDKPDTSED